MIVIVVAGSAVSHHHLIQTMVRSIGHVRRSLSNLVIGRQVVQIATNQNGLHRQ